MIAVGAIGLATLAALGGSIFFLAQRADYGWDPAVDHPTFTTEHPRVLFDEGHHNASTAGLSGRYWPFAKLLRADGYEVERGHGAFTPGVLRGVRVLVVANASGAPKPQLFGVNLPVKTDRRRGDPAFTGAEIEVVRSWMEEGGSLLLVADHAPFGEAAAGLGSALGVTLHRGFVEVPGELSDPLLFSAQNGRLGEHPIISGDGPAARVSRVHTYTGQSLDGPPGATVLLALPANAVEAVPAGDFALVERPAGRAQGLAFEYGRGRVVVLGESGMATAQVSRGAAYGMSGGNNDNRLFVLNAMRWLSRRL
jgi:hypothetical protein